MRSLLQMNTESTIPLILSNPYPSPDEVIMAPTHLMRSLLRLDTVSTVPLILSAEASLTLTEGLCLARQDSTVERSCIRLTTRASYGSLLLPPVVLELPAD